MTIAATLFGVEIWIIFVGIGIGWIFQLILTHRQAMGFNDALKPLRQQGRTAVGIGGRRYRGGRAFVALAQQGDSVVDARVMTGFTTFARPLPYPKLNGLSPTLLAGDESIPDLPAKVRDAARMAASTLLSSDARASKPE